MAATSTITVRPSCVAELRHAATALLEDHWTEVACYKDALPFAPDWDALEDLEVLGALLVLAAWADGRMVGYSVTTVSAPLQCKDRLVAQNVAIFLAKSHRRGASGRELVLATEAAVKARGAAVLRLHGGPGSPATNCFARAGFAPEAVMFSKELF